MRLREAYPLDWPENVPRAKKRIYGSFKTGFGAARHRLRREIELLGGKELIISSNVPLTNSGMPRANAPEPDDRGIAVYFTYEGKSMVFACDQYHYTRDNVHAIALTIGALRGIKRWGASDMLERAFRGFTALPERSVKWRDVLGFGHTAQITVEAVEARYRVLAKVHHPDVGGNAQQFHIITEARAEARAELGT